MIKLHIRFQDFTTVLMFRTILFFMLVLPGFSLVAQSWDPVYFPRDLMEEDGVETVIEYETEIEDPLELAGQGNRIRLARKMNYELFFASNGEKVSLQKFDEKGKVRDQIGYEFHDDGRLMETAYTHFQPASVDTADSSTILHQRYVTHFYLENGKQDYRKVQTGKPGEDMQTTDKIQFHYDVLGRLEKQVHYIYRDSIPDSLLIRYNHFARGLNITTSSGEKTLHRELLKFDDEDRLISREYFGSTNPAPRYREVYTYNPRGWLENVEYVYDWEFYQQKECVIHRENHHDDHGKLSEATLDYGDGRRVVKYYDYSYHPQNEEQ